jgi:hypothetical protein
VTAVQAQTLPASQADIYALGDCITVDGQVSRHIGPIANQTRTILAQIRGGGPQPHQVCPMVVQVKTLSMTRPFFLPTLFFPSSRLESSDFKVTARPAAVALGALTMAGRNNQDVMAR